jgi:predicted DNA-binding protein with PD1-like motif
MRQVRQPGPAPAERIQWVDARGHGFTFTVPAGLSLLEAVRQGLAARGFASGVANFRNAALGPFAYVMPALSKTPEHAAFYSETYRPHGVARLSTGTMTFGRRDDAPFFHCHALWTEEGGAENGGHVLPDETVVAEPFEVEAFGIDGAAFIAEGDPETNFKLFGPLATLPGHAETSRRAFALRLRPNQDVALALEAFCAGHGISRARIRGGVGSTIGARFADNRIVEPFATELTITAGDVVADTDGKPVAALDVALVDHTGALAKGRLLRGDNPVLMTMELVLEVLA